MSNSQPSLAASYSLHVIIGEQSGADLELKDRANYSIGASDECRIVLFGKGLADVHLECVFFENTLTILECENDVKLDGQPFASTPFAVQPGQLISFADITLAFGESNSDWDEIASKAVELNQQEQKEQKAVASKKRRARFGYLALLVGITLLVGLLGAGGYWLLADQSSQNIAQLNQVQQVQPQPLEKFKSLLSTSPAYANVDITGNQDNNADRPIIKGIVKSAEDIAKLRQVLAGNQVTPVYYVAVHDQLIEDSKIALRRFDFGLNYKLEFKKPQLILQLAGLADNYEDYDQIRKVVKDNLPIIDEIELNVKPASDLMHDLEVLQSNRTEYASINFAKSNGGLKIQGAILANYMDNFDKDLDQVFSKYEPNSIKVNNQVEAGPEFVGKVISVLISPESKYAVIRYGDSESRAMAGSILRNDFVLKDITKSHLVIEHAGTEYLLRLH